MLKDITIIIPAHNRPDRLERLLKYYSGSGARILIPDSSASAYTGPIPEPENTIYLHRPGVHFLRKVHEVLPLIHTDFVCYCADDDFITPTGLAACADFMRANPDFSCVQGHYLTFTPQKGKVKFTPRYIRYFDKRVTSDNPLERLAEEKCMYGSLLYGLVRTDAFRRLYAHYCKEDGTPNFNNLFLAEEFFNHGMLMLGKYATLPVFYSARERIPGSATETVVPPSVIKNSPHYRREYDGYLNALAALLCECSDLDYKAAYDTAVRISAAPIDTRAVLLKRRLLGFISKHPIFAPLKHWADLRYEQKGLNAVRGMDSYPCLTQTPEIRDILKAVK